jgi:glycosyltransferase involved in cell wall biosynthesis
MKILHLIHCYYPSIGGSQYLFQNVSERLVSQFDDDVTVLATNALEDVNNREGRLVPIGEETVEGVKVRRFPFSRRWLPVTELAFRVSRKARLPFRDYVELLYRGPIAPDMLRAMLDFDADVIAATPFYYLHMFYPCLARRLGRRMPLVYYGALHVIDGYVRRPILRAVRAAEAYIAYTDCERDILVSKGVPKEKIHVVGLGVNLEQFANANGQAMRNRLGINDEPVVAYIGRQACGKGIDTLLYAMREVWKKIPCARLLVAGARGSFSRELHQLVNDLSPRERDKVTIVDGFTEDEKPDLFAASDIVVLVSGVESFGIVYLEAWASEKPVIGSKADAVQSVIRDGQDGLLVPYGDVDQLAVAILALLNDHKLRATLAQNGLAKVQAGHSWEVVTQRLRMIYEQVRRC